MYIKAKIFLAGSLIIVICGILTFCTAGCGNKQNSELNDKKVVAVDMAGIQVMTMGIMLLEKVMLSITESRFFISAQQLKLIQD